MASFNEFVTNVTQDFFLPKVVDQVLNSNVLFVRLFTKPKPFMGEQLKVVIKTQKNPAGGSFGTAGTFNTAQTNTRKVMKFDPKFYYQAVTLYGTQVSINQMKQTQIIDLIRTEMESNVEDLSDTLGSAAYGIGSGDDMTGLDGIIDDGTNLSTYGELSRTDYPMLNSSVTTVGGPITLGLMASSYDSAKSGNKKPTIAITDEATWTDYEALLNPLVQAQYNALGAPQVGREEKAMPGQALKGQIGFDALMFRGKPIVADEKSPSGDFVWINEDFLNVYTLKLSWGTPINLDKGTIEGGYYDGISEKNFGFTWTGWKEPTNQYARTGQILWAGNMIDKMPKSASKLESLT